MMMFEALSVLCALVSAGCWGRAACVKAPRSTTGARRQQRGTTAIAQDLCETARLQSVWNARAASFIVAAIVLQAARLIVYRLVRGARLPALALAGPRKPADDALRREFFICSAHDVLKAA